jgi:hypothetical protein
MANDFQIRFTTNVESDIQVTEQELIALVLEKIAKEIKNATLQEYRSIEFHKKFHDIIWDNEVIGQWRLR